MRRDQEWCEKDMMLFQDQQYMRFHRKSLKVLKSTCMLRPIALTKTKRRMFQGQVTMIFRTLRTLDTIEEPHSLLEPVKDLILEAARKAK